MTRARLGFSKFGGLVYVGHLDFLRLFLQAVRRSGLPAAYSQGFNPHLLLSFALPLPLGFSSECDCADLVLTEPTAPAAVIKALNDAAPSGLLVTSCAEVSENERAAAAVRYADYCLELRNYVNTESVLARDSIVIAKKTKGGVKDTEIRNDVISMVSDGNALRMRLSAGSERFLNPLAACGLLTDEPPRAMSRTGLFGEGFVTLV